MKKEAAKGNNNNDNNILRTLQIDYSSESSTKTETTTRTRTIGYAMITTTYDDKNKNNTTTQTTKQTETQIITSAIVYFYPLSGSCLYLQTLIPSITCNHYKCNKIICIDRPGCGQTSDLIINDNNNSNNNTIDTNNEMKDNKKDNDDNNSNSNNTIISDDEYTYLTRIRGHIDDVMYVLKHENINHVYCLGVCLGHVYAIELCNRLLMSNDDNNNNNIQLKGLTLIAPFVSTVAPDSWYIARLGASIPSYILYGFTEVAVYLGTLLLPMVLKPSTLKRLVNKEEITWTDEELQQVCDLILQIDKDTCNVKALEARLGASPIWQYHICDKFDINIYNNNTEFPIRIHVSNEDKLLSIKAAKWIINRCYSSSSSSTNGGNIDNDILIIEDNIHSHEMMTLLGGPPSQPILLHKIAKQWNLL